MPLVFASESMQKDREVVLEAVKSHGWALQFASVALRGDREVVMTDARHGSATEALKIVRALNSQPSWQERELELAVEVLEAFPVTDTSPKVHQKLHSLVENMIKRIYHPNGCGGKRDRAAFEENFCA